jgi:hypothetical protein
MGTGGIVPRILTIGTKIRAQLHGPCRFTSNKHAVPIRSEDLRGWVEYKACLKAVERTSVLAGNRTPAAQPIAQLLYRYPYFVTYQLHW